MNRSERVVLVTVVGPAGRVDVAADAGAPVAELCAPLAAAIGFAEGVASVTLLPTREPGRSRSGHLGSTLAALGALDGDTLAVMPPHLRPRHAMAGWHASPDTAHTEPLDD